MKFHLDHGGTVEPSRMIGENWGVNDGTFNNHGGSVSWVILTSGTKTFSIVANKNGGTWSCVTDGNGRPYMYAIRLGTTAVN